jgi:hypothetical protein
MNLQILYNMRKILTASSSIFSGRVELHGTASSWVGVNEMKCSHKEKGPGEERLKYIFIHFPFLFLPGALKCVISNNPNEIRKNEFQNKFSYCLSVI